MLRAVRRQREALQDEHKRLADLVGKMSDEEMSRLIELEAELNCIESSLRWLWRQPP